TLAEKPFDSFHLGVRSPENPNSVRHDFLHLVLREPISAFGVGPDLPRPVKGSDGGILYSPQEPGSSEIVQDRPLSRQGTRVIAADEPVHTPCRQPAGRILGMDQSRAMSACDLVG